MTQEQKGAIVEAREALAGAHAANELAKTGYPELCKYLEDAYKALKRLDNEVINAVPDKAEKHIVACDNTYPFTAYTHCVTVLDTAKILADGLRGGV